MSFFTFPKNAQQKNSSASSRPNPGTVQSSLVLLFVPSLVSVLAFPLLGVVVPDSDRSVAVSLSSLPPRLLVSEGVPGEDDEIDSELALASGGGGDEEDLFDDDFEDEDSTMTG
jgi:hypothetical protein